MRNIAIFLIHIYRNYLSVFKLQQTCRFYPSCSEYSCLALEKHGLLKGLWFSMLRVLRCHPLSPGGYDPVKCRTEKSKEVKLRHPEELLKKFLHSG